MVLLFIDDVLIVSNTYLNEKVETQNQCPKIVVNVRTMIYF